MVIPIFKSSRDLALFDTEELKRKLFHMLTSLYVLAYWFLPREFVLQSMGALIIIIIIAETVRMNNTPFNRWLLGKLGGVYRKEETNHFSGILWTFLGSFFTMLIFKDRHIVTTSLLYLSFGDAVAALIGKKLGKNRILNGKSIEGSIACFVVCLSIGLLLLDWKIAIWGAAIATLIEIIPWPLNDNFCLPLISSLVLTFFSKQYM